MTTIKSADGSMPILGGWRLVTAYQVQENGEKQSIWPGLKGHILFLSERMFCFTSRDSPEGVKDGILLVYTGPCEISADSFTTRVDMTSIDGFLGTTQKRFYKIEGDILDIRPAAPDGKPMQSHLIWKREI